MSAVICHCNTVMQMPWSRIPELADLPARERRQLWRKALRDPFRPSDALILLGLIAGSVALGCVVLPSFPTGEGHPVAAVAFVLVVFAWGEFGHAVIVWRYRPVARRLRGPGV